MQATCFVTSASQKSEANEFIEVFAHDDVIIVLIYHV